MLNGQDKIADGTLEVRRSKQGGICRVSLCGELDIANAGTAKEALDEALDDSTEAVVIDMRELEFIDSSGIALLVSILGREDGRPQLEFVPSESPSVTRVLELTGVSQRLPLAGQSS
jgi:anti-sigma B factor antagonist